MAFSTPKACGFTLIELVFVAIVLAILMVSTAPSFKKSFDRIKLEQSAFSVVQSLRCTRTVSISQSRVLRWEWDPAKNSSVILAVNENGSLESKADFRICQTRLDEPVGLASSADSGSALVLNFFPDGTADAASFSVFGLGKDSYEISIDGPSAQVSLKQKSLSSN